MLAAVLVLAGCSSKEKSPQEVLKESMTKSAEMKSYRFSGSLRVEDLSIASPSGDDALGIGAMLNMLKGSELSWSGAYRLDPLLMEMDMSLALKGDMAVTLNIPMVITKEKMWVKIPSIPFVPLPEDVAGKKFLEIDMKQMAEKSGQPMPEFDPAKSQKFVNDVMAIIFDNIEEEQYFSNVKPGDAGVPDDAGVKQVVQFKVAKDQVEPFVKTAVEKIAPAMLDLFANNEEYRNMMGMTPEDIAEAKKELEAVNAEQLNDGLEEFKKAVKTLDIVANLGIDSNGFLVYNDLSANTEFDADGSAVKLAIKLVSQMKDINKEVEFQYPDGPADVITMEEFEKKMGAAFGM